MAITTRITALPDLCLLMIFDDCLLTELSNVFLTCQRWGSLRKATYARRRSIRISLKKKNENRFENQFHLYSNVLTKTQVDWLVRTFPNINQLEILIDFKLDESTIYWIILLIYKWADKLKSFSYCNMHSDNEHIHEFLRSINCLSKLQHLGISIYDSNNEKSGIAFEKLPLPILSQLKTFHFTDVSKVVDFCSWVSKYHDCNSELEISYFEHGHNATSQDDWNEVYRIAGPFLHQFTSICSPTKPDFDQFRQFCFRFRSLTSVDVTDYSFSLKQLTQCLALLPKLKHLMIFNSHDHNLLTDCSGPGEFMPLPKVTDFYLTLYHTNIDPQLFNLIPYPTIFPNLKKFDLSSLYRGFRDIKLDQAKPYASAFKNCLNIEKVKIGNPIHFHIFTKDQL